MKASTKNAGDERGAALIDRRVGDLEGELQSLNEELHTVNQELKVKIEELSNANDDFRNLMFSTDIGTVFLDRALRIKLFTPRARDIFNLIPADVGRPLSDISSNFPHDGLLADIEAVLDRLNQSSARSGRATELTDAGRALPHGGRPHRGRRAELR